MAAALGYDNLGTYKGETEDLDCDDVGVARGTEPTGRSEC